MEKERRCIMDLWKALSNARATPGRTEPGLETPWYLPLPIGIRVDRSLPVGPGRTIRATTFSWAAFDAATRSTKALTFTVHPN